MLNFKPVFSTLFMLISLWGLTAQANDVKPVNPLQPFELLIGGSWHLQDSYQQFSWGAGNQSIIAKNYFIKNNQSHLVSEGFWYWHPAEKVIKGIFTATNMPFSLVEYTTVFDGNQMNNKLTTYNKKGQQEIYLETWEFTGTQQYLWKLKQSSGGKLQTIMSGTFTRKSE